eukprot:TRINITY_DN125_c0_g1_i1.p2 TRINITY_DN125_c0_g1~~TRINITY_DN125_c0_g1_i1.p2  ORF type:complete len:122 (+),score=29.09 TRINITY_DN125_c0_g1_i1:121-486(+)
MLMIIYQISLKIATIDNIFDDDNDIVDLSIGYNNDNNQNNNRNNKKDNDNDKDDNDNEDNDEDNDNDNENDNENENENERENKNDNNDALVIIGRKSRVELCIFMIEMTLNHFSTNYKNQK